jgi:hypothetical protein
VNTKTGVYMAENKNDSIIFEAEDGTEVEFAVLEQTTLGGINYLFVVDKADDESFLILREDSGADTEEMAAYDIVEDEKELDAVIRIFDELLEDVNLEV